MNNKKRKVCIFGSQVASALQGNAMGGAELQMAMLAKTLAEHNIEVVVIDREAKEDFQFDRNIQIRSIPGWYRGIRGLRFFTHRVPNFIRTLRNIHASLFYVRGISYLFLIPLYVAKRCKAKFVLAISHDSELWRFQERFKVFYRKNSSVWDWISTNIPNEVAAYFLVRFCDVLLVQHEEQAQKVSSLGKKVILLPNMFDPRIEHISRNKSNGNIVIIGALSNRKGLDLFLPVVQKLKHVTFEFVGEAEDIEGNRIKEQLKKCPNAILHGWLNREDTLRKIASAKALVNTSRMEGFPNAFIEAWALRTPVISLSVDPGNVIKNHKLGYVCNGNVELLEELLLKDTLDLNTAQIQDYVLKRHSAKYTINVFEDIIS
jgi:glycosyltransferase involved in cell wall biosynthesis